MELQSDAGAKGAEEKRLRGVSLSVPPLLQAPRGWPGFCPGLLLARAGWGAVSGEGQFRQRLMWLSVSHSPWRHMTRGGGGAGITIPPRPQ